MTVDQRIVCKPGICHLGNSIFDHLSDFRVLMARILSSESEIAYLRRVCIISRRPQ